MTDHTDDAKLAVRVMGDRIMCALPDSDDRRSKAGIIIPATAKTADRRGLWGTVTEVGPLVRSVRPDDRVLFLPESAIEVDVRGDVFLIVRERDVHAVASSERDVGPMGLYL
jgi:chaperonin GroES